MSYKKIGYLTLGWFSLALGVLGIVLPLLPTTPFVLLSAFCFSRSSRRFHLWLLNHKLFGGLIRDWERDGVIALKAKLLATASMLIMVTLSLYFIAIPFVGTATILISMGCVLLFIWTRPSKPKNCIKPKPISDNKY